MIIYKTTNKINGKIYVGKDSKNNPKYLGSGKYLKRAIKKYGKENFTKEILCECNTKEELNEKEIYYIKQLNSINRKIGYNLTYGGDGGDTFTNNPNKNKILKKIKPNSKTKIKIQNSVKKLWGNIEYRNHMINIHKNYIMPLNHKMNIGNSLKISKKHKLAMKNKERSKKISTSLIKYKNICQWDKNNILIKRWDCNITNIEKKLKIYNIWYCLIGKRKSAGGYIWTCDCISKKIALDLINKTEDIIKK